MLDPEGNYYAALPDEVRGSGTGSISTLGSGTGAPNGTTKVTTVYVDISTGIIYSYVSGSWVASGSVGGTGQLVAYSSGSPANPADISQPAFAYDPNGVLPPLGWRVSDHTWN